MRRPGRIAPGVPQEGSDPHIGFAPRSVEDERAVLRLLESIEEDAPRAPDGLDGRVARRVRDRIALHDFVEITTRAFARTTLLPLAERLGAWMARARPGAATPRPPER